MIANHLQEGVKYARLPLARRLHGAGPAYVPDLRRCAAAGRDGSNRPFGAGRAHSGPAPRWAKATCATPAERGPASGTKTACSQTARIRRGGTDSRRTSGTAPTSRRPAPGDATSGSTPARSQTAGIGRSGTDPGAVEHWRESLRWFRTQSCAARTGPFSFPRKGDRSGLSPPIREEFQEFP